MGRAPPSSRKPQCTERRMGPDHGWDSLYPPTSGPESADLGGCGVQVVRGLGVCLVSMYCTCPRPNPTRTSLAMFGRAPLPLTRPVVRWHWWPFRSPQRIESVLLSACASCSVHLTHLCIGRDPHSAHARTSMNGHNVANLLCELLQEKGEQIQMFFSFGLFVTIISSPCGVQV